MDCFYIFILTFLVVSVYSNPSKANGVLILYRPLDISNDCAQSANMRFDVSFGNGMSDTITLVFRKVSELDYQCEVDIRASSDDDQVWLLIVIRFPNELSENCASNHNAFIIKRRDDCFYLCDHRFEHTLKNYFLMPVLGRFRFGFMSNSSVNVGNANIYQVTATAARLIPENATCAPRNETDCMFQRKKYCFTSGSVCDGIKNCGVADWFDERKSKCGEPIERLTSTAAAAVVAALILAVLFCSHVITSCLPQSANSFFIFNENEDNRLCIDPLQIPQRELGYELEHVRRNSLIPVSSSSSSETAPLADAELQQDVDLQSLEAMIELPEFPSLRGYVGFNQETSPKTETRRTTTVRSMTARLLRAVTERLAATASVVPTPEQPRRPSIQLL